MPARGDRPGVVDVPYLDAPLMVLPPSLEAFHALKKGKYWRKQAWAARKFDERFGPSTFAVLTRVDDLEHWLPRVHDLFMQRWEPGTSRSAWVSAEGFQPYHQAMLDLAGSGEASLAVLYRPARDAQTAVADESASSGEEPSGAAGPDVDRPARNPGSESDDPAAEAIRDDEMRTRETVAEGGELLAYGFLLEQGRSLYFYQHAASPSERYRSFSLGTRFLIELLEHVVASGRYDVFDFMVGVMPYKLQWATCIQRVYQQIVRTDYTSELAFRSAVLRAHGVSQLRRRPGLMRLARRWIG